MRSLYVAALLCGAALVLSVGRAQAAPSFLGPYGNILTPSADTPGASQWALAFYHRPYRNLITADYGPRDRFEIGLTLVDPSQPGTEPTKVALNGKFVLAHEGKLAPAVAVGLWDAFGWVNKTSYAVATKSIDVPWSARPLRASLGFGSGEFKRVFWGVAVPVNGFASGIAEFDGTNLNIGARVLLPRGFVLDVAALNWELGAGAAYGVKW